MQVLGEAGYNGPFFLTHRVANTICNREAKRCIDISRNGSIQLGHEVSAAFGREGEGLSCDMTGP